MTSKTRYSRHRVRCTNMKCRTRDVLKKHPDEYAKRPRCVVCKGNLRSIEQERRNELAKQERCYCVAIPFAHRKGSLRFCEHHPLAGVEPTEQEWFDFEELCKTPRSG